MPVFISYNQRDEAAYSSLCLALEGQNIEYWDPKTMKVGGSLREQLREGIKRCEVCIFLATRKSINSAWCSAELGAFWGAGIRVIVFISDAELAENEIPPQFQGNLWTRDVRQIVRDVKAEILAAAHEKKVAIIETKKSEVLKNPRLVSDMTIEMFNSVISSVHSNESRRLFETIILLREAFFYRPNYTDDKRESFFENENKADLLAFAVPLLNSLIGVSVEQIKSMGERYWKESFTLITSTGSWLGFALETDFQNGGYDNCLLFHFNSSQCDATVLTERVGIGSIGGYHGEEEDSVYYEPIIASSGTVALGEPSEYN